MARRWGILAWPARWWGSQSLRARLTLLSTALFSIAVATGAVLLLEVQRVALVRVLDSSALRTAREIGTTFRQNPDLKTITPPTGGVTVEVVDPHDAVLATTPGGDRFTPILGPEDMIAARHGARFDLTSPATGLRERVLAVHAGPNTVVVATDLSRVDDSVRVLTRAALIGGPLAVLLMGSATYLVVGLTLRSVAALRHGAADITAAGLADQRLPVPSAQDEIHRLAVTLNAMLDRIDSATARQRTFVGDAAHELRSPLASLRVQLEVAQRLGPDGEWPDLIDDVLVDVSRLDRLVADLLALARMDESARRAPRREPVRFDELVGDVSERYRHARVPVTLDGTDPVTIMGDPDGLRRIVLNLTDNAVRYASTGVELSVHRSRAAGRPVLSFTVTDDGPGIPPDERERVFDRFYRLEESRSRESGGTGLGLPIVRDLARSHGGSVRLTDPPDGASGLRAVVTLPIDPPAKPR